MKRLLDLFKKRLSLNTNPEVRHFYYGIILTHKKMPVSDSNIVSLFSIRDYIYPNAQYLFTSYDAVIDYIRKNLLEKGHNQPCFAYQISIRPYILQDDQTLMRYIDMKNAAFDLRIIHDSDVIIREDVLQKIVNMNIRSGIQNIEYLHVCMRVGYKDFIDNIVWKDFISSCIQYGIKPTIIKDYADKFGKEQVLVIYDRMFKKSDTWIKEFEDELKHILLFG